MFFYSREISLVIQDMSHEDTRTTSIYIYKNRVGTSPVTRYQLRGFNIFARCPQLPRIVPIPDAWYQTGFQGTERKCVVGERDHWSTSSRRFTTHPCDRGSVRGRGPLIMFDMYSTRESQLPLERTEPNISPSTRSVQLKPSPDRWHYSRNRFPYLSCR